MARWNGGGSHDNIDRILARTEPLQEQLQHHPVYSRITDLETARSFMECHVFAVWDFMSLLKTLQCTLTRVEVPWVPVGDPAVRRFVNELVLQEESDEHPEGGYTSHFELYVDAMRQAGCDTDPITKLVAGVAGGEHTLRVLDRLHLPRAVEEFVSRTIDVAQHGEPHEVAATLTFGREELIPQMFTPLLEAVEASPERLGLFRDYLVRHIALDGDMHGPLAFGMLVRICGDDEKRWVEAENAAVTALHNRVALWDGVLAELPSAVR